MKRRRMMILVTAVVVAAAMLGARHAAIDAATTQQTAQAPMFTLELLWPKPLPSHQLLGSATGIAIDSRDHIYVLNLPNSFVARTEIGATATPPIGECCFPSQNVVEFDADGKYVGEWGGTGTGFQWPSENNGLAIDPQGNLWMGGSGGSDTQILKFSRDGRFVAAIGKAGAAAAAPAPGAAAADTAYLGVSRGRAAAGADTGGRGGRGAGGARGGRGGGRGAAPALPPNSNATDAFGGAMDIAFDASANEAFIADGSRNHRVAVVDIATGAIKRFWGAYGTKPTDDAVPAYTMAAPPAKQFATVACVALATDGLLYVCDRQNDRIQVFRKTGEYVKEMRIMPNTLGSGSVWDVTFSRDPQQRYLYVADGSNMKVHILDRQTLALLTSFGDGGRIPGEFQAVHSVATDSKGNLYTVEASQGKRIQKFAFKGVGAVVKNQGVLKPGGQP